MLAESDIELGSGTYIFRWRPDDPYSKDWQWHCYQVCDEKGTSAVRNWIRSNRDRIFTGNYALQQIPIYELAFIGRDRGVPYYLYSKVPVRPGPKAETPLVENLSESELERLRALFEKYGTKTDGLEWTSP